MRVRTLAVLGLALAVTAPPGTAQPPTGFAGSYTARGTNPGGEGVYTGTVTIVAREDVYDVGWAIGQDEFHGVGVVAGDVLSVGFAGSRGAGVVAYRKDSDGSLTGVWAGLGGPGRLGKETLVRARR